MFFSNPVCIWQIDSNWGTWSRIAAFYNHGDCFCCYSFYVFLFVIICNRTVIFKPLSLLCYCFDPLCRYFIPYAYSTFIRSFFANCIEIDFDKTIDYINFTCSVLYPSNTVFIENFEITGFVVLYK